MQPEVKDSHHLLHYSIKYKNKNMSNAGSKSFFQWLILSGWQLSSRTVAMWQEWQSGTTGGWIRKSCEGRASHALWRFLLHFGGVVFEVHALHFGKQLQCLCPRCYDCLMRTFVYLKKHSFEVNLKSLNKNLKKWVSSQIYVSSCIIWFQTSMLTFNRDRANVGTLTKGKNDYIPSAKPLKLRK